MTEIFTAVPAWAAPAALVVGLALGPLLDRLARWSLREPAAESSAWHARPIATGLTAGVGGAVSAIAVPEALLLPAWLALAWIAAPVVRTDIARHRIPDPLNLAAIASGAVLLLVPGDLDAYARAWLAAGAVTAIMLALALVGSSGLGMGDVKLAPALGLYLGYLGWEAVLVGVAAGFVLGAMAAIVILVRDALRRRPVSGALRRALPFGPFLLLGAFVGLVAS